MNLKIQPQLAMTNLICLMVFIQSKIFKITLNVSSKNTKLYLKILPYKFIQTKSKNRNTFKIKAGYKLGFLSPETIKLLRSTKKDATKDKDGEDVPKLESVKVV